MSTVEVLNDHGTVQYREHDLQVRRVDAASAGYDTGFENEFELLVDDEVVATATEIEAEGWKNPWAKSLRLYGKAFVDGRLDG